MLEPLEMWKQSGKEVLTAWQACEEVDLRWSPQVSAGWDPGALAVQPPSFTNKERETLSWFSLLPPVQAFPTVPSLESHLLEPEVLIRETYRCT